MALGRTEWKDHRQLLIKCGNNKQCSKSKVERENTNQVQSKHGPLQNLEVGSVAMEE